MCDYFLKNIRNNTHILNLTQIVVSIIIYTIQINISY